MWAWEMSFRGNGPHFCGREKKGKDEKEREKGRGAHLPLEMLSYGPVPASVLPAATLDVALWHFRCSRLSSLYSFLPLQHRTLISANPSQV